MHPRSKTMNVKGVGIRRRRRVKNGEGVRKDMFPLKRQFQLMKSQGQIRESIQISAGEKQC